MTKTLTEQWREGTMEEGLYYVEGKGNYDIALIRNRYCPVLTSPYCEDDVFESEFVPVAPVPSYEKWKNMDDLLLIYKEENKRLKAVKEHCENVAGQYADKLVDTERNVERLEKQLAIATKALKEYERCENGSYANKALALIKEVE